MYMNLLSDSLSWNDRLSYMGVGALVGMLVVFAVLALLWLILELFGFIARRSKKSSEKAVPAPQPITPVAEPEPVPATNDDEIVAAITAALAIYMEEAKAANPSINGFRVVSFKKVGSTAHWNQN